MDLLDLRHSEEGAQKEWLRWRSDQVTRFVREARRMIRSLKPNVKLSAAVKPDPKRAYRRFGQDWVRWVNRRLLDFVVPMFYSRSTEVVQRQMREARKYVQRGSLYAGIGAWNQTPGHTVVQVEKARTLGLQGIVVFSHTTLAEQSGLSKALAEGPFAPPTARGRRLRIEGH